MSCAALDFVSDAQVPVLGDDREVLFILADQAHDWDWTKIPSFDLFSRKTGGRTPDSILESIRRLCEFGKISVHEDQFQIRKIEQPWENGECVIPKERTGFYDLVGHAFNPMDLMTGSPVIHFRYRDRNISPRKDSKCQRHSERRPLTLVRRFKILHRDRFTCRYCGKNASQVDLEVDHVVPISKGGSDDDSNLAAACYACNRGKRADLL